MKINTRLQEVIALVILVSAILSPRIFGLDQFVTVDEPKWLVRSANFYEALGQRNFSNAYQTEHPGVTVMWLGTAAMVWEFPEYRGLGVGQQNIKGLQTILQENDIAPIDILATSRLFVVLAITNVLVAAYFYTKELTGTLPAFIGFSLIAIDPIFTAHSRLQHLDGLLSSLMLLSFVSWLVYLKRRNRLDLLVSGISLGFAILTKSPAVFLLPIIGLVTLVHEWDAIKENYIQRKKIWVSLAALIGPIVFMGIIALLVIIVIWPAMWVAPLQSFQKVFVEAFAYAQSGHGTPIFFNGEIIQDGDLGPLSFSHFYPTTFLWRTTPLIIVGIAGLVFFGVLSRQSNETRINKNFVLHLAIFVLSFYLIQNMGGKKFFRYILPAYLPLTILAGYGLTRIYQALRNKSIPRQSAVLVFIALLFLQVSALIDTYPYYLTYYNPFHGSSKNVSDVMLLGWGEGLDEAARYLAEKPDAENLDVFSWYRPGSFSFFFPGEVSAIHTYANISAENLNKIWQADYAVIYVHQWQRQIPIELIQALEPFEPEKIIWLNGIEYVRIYHIPDLPVSVQP